MKKIFYSEPLSKAEIYARYKKWIRPCRKSTEDVIKHFQAILNLELMPEEMVQHHKTSTAFTFNIEHSGLLPPGSKVDLIGFYIKEDDKSAKYYNATNEPSQLAVFFDRCTNHGTSNCPLLNYEIVFEYGISEEQIATKATGVFSYLLAVHYLESLKRGDSWMPPE